ncbi:MAG: winged helix-turn-helix transcriptional regulator [Firmicutes bacterium]|nr:winged helix-turn-helix transcriptional regulator [Bacillota bacterium]
MAADRVLRTDCCPEFAACDLCSDFHCNLDTVSRWKNNLPPLTEAVAIFKALANETRASILYLLAHEELCVCDLATILDSTISNISHHLRLLRTLKLVQYRRQGKMAFYSISDNQVKTLLNHVFEQAQLRELRSS